MNSKTTAVLGASNKPERYSNKAVRMLREYGHSVIPIHPLHKQIEGIDAVQSVDQLPLGIDTITVYVGAETSEKLISAIVARAPRRVIINPGAESQLLEESLRKMGVLVERACTLVLLQTGQF
ncbi:MAG: CoA-binding protein [Pseudomonadota bacterium]|jgi:predicted CoA-binding protein